MIKTSHAFLIYLNSMVLAYVWATFLPAAPYLIFATYLTGGFGAYVGKRLIQKKKEYGGEQ